MNVTYMISELFTVFTCSMSSTTYHTHTQVHIQHKYMNVTQEIIYFKKSRCTTTTVPPPLYHQRSAQGVPRLALHVCQMSNNVAGMSNVKRQTSTTYLLRRPERTRCLHCSPPTTGNLSIASPLPWLTHVPPSTLYMYPNTQRLSRRV